MGLSSKLASSNVLDYWSQELFEDGGLQIPKLVSQARNDKNSDGSSGVKINDQESAQTRKHWPPLRCPRCDSINTKFCYYNNYSKSQPRYFCKACRRHWTEGGTLRNVPVGGGRKNKRAKSGTSSSSTTATNTATNGSTGGSSALMIPLPPPPPQQNKLSGLTLFGADHISSIFPEVLRQVLFHPPPPPQFQLSQSGTYNTMHGTNLSISSQGSVFPPDLLISPLPYASGDDLEAAGGAWAQASTPTTAPSSSGGGVLEQTRGPFWSGWDDDFDATRASSDAR